MPDKLDKRKKEDEMWEELDKKSELPKLTKHIALTIIETDGDIVEAVKKVRREVKEGRDVE